ncbi:MAG: thioredoxin domain-containing protein [Patescibacteria group bacterium]
MASIDQSKKIFILGSIFLGVLVVVGLVWAIASDTSAGNGTTTAPTFVDTNDQTFGPADATVTIRVFSDFQCPACRSADAGLRYAMATYGNRVKFVWNDFPLQSIHANSLLASDAARAAGEQGKFWEYSERLFADQPNWESLADPTEKFIAYAQALDLDATAFNAALTNRKYESFVMDDLREGGAIGIEATPTFYINDTKFLGALDRDTWDKEIKARLGQP